MKVKCPFDSISKRCNYRYEDVQYIKDPLKQAAENLMIRALRGFFILSIQVLAFCLGEKLVSIADLGQELTLFTD